MKITQWVSSKITLKIVSEEVGLHNNSKLETDYANIYTLVGYLVGLNGIGR